MAICGCISYHMEGNHTTWKDFLPGSWISYHIPGFPTTYLNFLPHTLVGLDVAVCLCRGMVSFSLLTTCKKILVLDLVFLTFDLLSIPLFVNSSSFRSVPGCGLLGWKFKIGIFAAISLMRELWRSIESETQFAFYAIEDQLNGSFAADSMLTITLLSVHLMYQHCPYLILSW